LEYEEKEEVYAVYLDSYESDPDDNPVCLLDGNFQEEDSNAKPKEEVH
jgi:hypothetical protein